MISMGAVWDRTVEFISERLGTLLPVAVLAIFVPNSIIGSFEQVRTGATPGLTMTLAILSLALTIVTFWGQLAVMAIAIDPKGSPVAVATRRLLPALALAFLLMLAALLLVVPVWIILWASGYDFTAAALSGTVAVPPQSALLPLAVYLIALVPLSLWLLARFVMLSTPIVVAEHRFLAAVPRAFWLTRGLAFKIIGVLLLYGLVSFVATLAAQSVFGSIFRLTVGDTDSPISLAVILTSSVTAMVSTGFTVLAAAFMAKLYLALVARHEARIPA